MCGTLTGEKNTKETTESRSKESKGSRKKFLVIGIVGILIATVFGASLLLSNIGALPDRDGDGVPDGQDAFPDDPNEWEDKDGDGIGDNADTDHGFGGITYVGTIIPAQYMGSTAYTSNLAKICASPSYYFLGYQKNDTLLQLQTFAISSSSVYNEIIGGEFEINGTSSSGYEIKNIISTATETMGISGLGAAMDSLFKNVKIDFSSVSLVYSNYTFGIGTSGTTDYIWVAPQKSYPTFFNNVTATGIIFNETALLKLATNFSDSIFDDIDLAKIADISSDFQFTFSGNSAKFLLVTNVTYKDIVSINCDVIDTITPAKIDKLASIFITDGTDWVKDIVTNLGEGIAVATESDLRIDNTKLWFMLYSLNDYTDFPGLCQIEVSKSDLSILTQKISALSLTSFDFTLNFEVNLGIITSVTAPQYTSINVTNIWQAVTTSHPKTMVMNADVKGYGIVVDLNSLLTSLSSAFGGISADAIKTITTFKNPAFVILMDENIPDMFNNAGTPVWQYSVLAIIPDYNTAASGFRYLDLKGVIYDPAAFFNINTQLCHIPILVADNYTEVTEGLQQLTIKDISQGNLNLNTYGWGYVEAPALPIGTTLKTIISQMPPTDPVTLALQKAVMAFPLDICVYEGFKIDGLTQVYHVPIIYIATGQGPTYYGLNVTTVRGMYVDYSASLDGLSSFFQKKINFTFDLGLPGIDSTIMNKIGAGISTLTDPLNNFIHTLMNSGVISSGYILAFSMNENTNSPPTVTINLPTEGSTVTIDDFDISITVQDNPDVALWAEIKIHDMIAGNLKNIFGLDVPIPAPIVKNGVWSTADSQNSWWWDDIKSYMNWTCTGNNNRIYVRVHDLKGYSVEKMRNFTISGVTPDTTPPTSSVDTLPPYKSSSTFFLTGTASDDRGVGAVELWYKHGGSWTYSSNDTIAFGGWSWSFDSSSTGGDGLYQFYSRAIDLSDNYESAPVINDTYTFIDTNIPSATATGPANSNSLTLNVSYSWSDLATTSGIASVHIYGKKTTAALWTDYGEDIDGTSPKQITVLDGDGTYQWCCFGVDKAGNSEPGELNPIKSVEAITIVASDIIKPTSWVNTLPAYENYAMIGVSKTFTITATAYDNKVVDAVELWYNNEGGGWTTNLGLNDTYGTDGWSWSFSAAFIGEGQYDFYTRAIDASGNYEDAPVMSDNGTFVDTVAPSATATGPSTSSTATFDVTYTRSDPSPASGINLVTLWYTTNYGLNWYEVGDDSDTSSPIQVTVSAAGHYGWILVARDNAGNAEGSPPIGLAEYTTTVNIDSGNSFATATDITGQLAWSETVDDTTDVNDYFKIWLDSGDSLTIGMVGPLLDDFDLYLYNPSQTQIDSSENLGSIEEVSWTATVTGYHYLRVNAYSGSGSYTLAIVVL